LLEIDADGERSDSGITPVQRFDWGDVRSLPPAMADRDDVLRLLLDLGSFLVRRHSRQEIYEAVLERADDLVGCELACLFLSGDTGLVEVHRRTSSPNREPHFSHTVLDKAVHDRAPLLVTDRLEPSASMVRLHIRSALAVPMFDNTNVIGVLYLDTRRKGKAFTEEDLRRVELLANALALKLTNSDFVEEIERAEEVQRSLLPRCPEVPAGYELAVRLRPCTGVAGDLYDVVPLSDGRFVLVLGDVAGHGVGAALLMATVLGTLRAIANQVTDARHLVLRLESQLSTLLADRGFVTLFAGILDPATHRLDYVNAGHEGVLVVHPDARLQRLEPTGPPLGLPIQLPFTAASVDLPRGALLCTWSDGFHEAHRMNGELEFFGDEPLLDTFSLRRAEPLHVIADELFARVDAFLGDLPAADDRALLLLRRSG
jgi:serine phosphatase RsbU (regulator of sigma subunit)